MKACRPGEIDEGRDPALDNLTPAMSYKTFAPKESGSQYYFFGLNLRSNLPLPGVSPGNLYTKACDVEVHLGLSPYSDDESLLRSEELTYVSSYANQAGEPALRIYRVEQGAFVRLAYEDGTQFWLDRERENIWATWPTKLSLENTSSYLLGPVLGLALRFRGVVCLHASAVAFENRSVAFVGQMGAGKSTTAAAFAQLGFGIISDDIVALVEHEGSFRVMPAYPHLCLWPESVRMFYDSSEALPRLIPDWDKRRLSLGEHGTRFESRCLPLGAVYVLGERGPDPAPYVESVSSQSAFIALVADTYANKILDREMRAHEFAVLGRLVSTVPIRRVHAHEDPTRLKELCNVIRKDLDSLCAARSAEL
jgi:hypothetical protein